MITPVNQSSSDPNGEYSFGREVLGKDAFFRILLTQLQFQDPLKPTEDREFIAQMAQFSSLEGMQNLNSEIGKLQAINLIGRTIQFKDEDGKILQGTVDGVKIDSGKAMVTIDGVAVDPGMITSILGGEGSK